MTQSPRPYASASPQVSDDFWSSIKRGNSERLVRALWYGQQGIGKSTMAAKMPNPLFLSTDLGACHLGARYTKRPTRYADVLSILGHLQRDPRDVKTLVIDVLDQVEALMRHDAVSEEKPWTDGRSKYTDFAKVPFGNADRHVIDAYWLPFLEQLLRLQETRQIHIVLLAWARDNGSTSDDFGNAIAQWSPALQHAFRISALSHVVGWCEDVLFFSWRRVATVGDPESRDSRQKQGKLLGLSQRVIRTDSSGAWVAKNRHGMPPEIEIDGVQQGWEALQSAMPTIKLETEK